jgi:hypothetical protein
MCKASGQFVQQIAGFRWPNGYAVYVHKPSTGLRPRLDRRGADGAFIAFRRCRRDFLTRGIGVGGSICNDA